MMILVILIIGLLAIWRVYYDYKVVGAIIDAVHRYNLCLLHSSKNIMEFEVNKIEYDDIGYDKYTFNLFKWTPKQYLGDERYEKLKPFLIWRN